MATNNYIVAIEIGSSKISGAVGLQTYSGIKILAYANESVSSFVSKGVVRNVDETGKTLNNLINRLESSLSSATSENLTIDKAYVAFGGLSMHTRRSSVVREFSEYTKITQDIIDEISLENDRLFNVPAGYQRVQVLPLECRLNGDSNLSPMGTPTRRIECNYQNILLREQYMKQLEESFAIPRIKIVDSFNAIILEAGILLSDEERSSGSALVNIGADTTTVAIYSGKLLRKLAVIPLGSNNITRDLCAEQIPYKEAEQMKIFKGYHSTDDDNSAIATELVDQIISARMSEILLNVRHQIETSETKVINIQFTGGGAKLKNISNLIDECLPSFKIKMADEESYSYICDDKLSLAKGAITPTLYGLLENGKENCCKEVVMPTPQQYQSDLFGHVETPAAPADEKEPEKPIEKPKEPEKEPTKASTPPKKKPSKLKIPSWLTDFVNNATNDEEDNVTDRD